MEMEQSKNNILIYLLSAVLVTAAVFFPALSNGFVNWDDAAYILNNGLIQSLTLENIGNMFTTLQVQGAYTPLVQVSWAVDYYLGEFNPSIYHWSNYLFHIVNVVLVFVLFNRLTKNVWIACFVALLFGIHPLHVESVAWVSARKDVLYFFFFSLGLITYLKYLDKNTKSQLYITFFLFILSLFAKGMAVVFPVILLLIDYVLNREEKWMKLVMEKAIFFIVSGIFVFINFKAQQAGSALDPIENIPFGESLIIGLYSTIIYLVKAFIPYQLSAFHPYFEGDKIPAYMYMGILLFAALIYGIYRFRKSNKELVFGLLFFLIGILPFSQILPFGSAIMAERYTYMAYIGLFYLMGYLLFVQFKDRLNKQYTLGIMIVVVLVFGFISFERTSVWKNGETLWTDVIKKYPDNYFAYGTRGNYWMDLNEFDLAMNDYNKSLSLNNKFYEGYNNRGLAYFNSGKLDEALLDFNQVVQLKPDYYQGHVNKGLILLNKGQYKEAVEGFNYAETLDQEDASLYYNRGLSYKFLGQFDHALADLTTAIGLNDNVASFYKDRGQVNLELHDYPKAIIDFNEVILMDDSDGEAYFMRSYAYFQMADYMQAGNDAMKAKEREFPVRDEYFEVLRQKTN